MVPFYYKKLSAEKDANAETMYLQLPDEMKSLTERERELIFRKTVRN